MEASEKIQQHSKSKFKVVGPGNYIELHPGTDDYRQFLQEAMLCKDIDTLSRIKGNANTPVHIIDSEFYPEYLDALTVTDNPVIVVARGLFRRWTKTEDGKYFDWQGKERAMPRVQGGWIEINAQITTTDG
jgi:hypothetical protein